MTNTNTADLSERSRVADERLTRVTAELTAAQDDVALLERLSGAQARVKALLLEQETAMEEAEAARAAQQAQREEARFVGLIDVNVVRQDDPGTPSASLTRAQFVITYTRLDYDLQAGSNRPTEHSVTGFMAVPDNVFAFLIARQPEKIPPEIMALCPGNPTGAFQRYFLALRRGYVEG